MGLTMQAVDDGPASRPRRDRRSTRTQRRQQRTHVEAHADNHATEEALWHFISSHGPDERYAAGLPELGNWTPWGDQHYRTADLGPLATDLAQAHSFASDPTHRAALQEAAELVQRCREHGWALRITAD